MPVRNSQCVCVTYDSLPVNNRTCITITRAARRIARKRCSRTWFGTRVYLSGNLEMSIVLPWYLHHGCHNTLLVRNIKFVSAVDTKLWSRTGSVQVTTFVILPNRNLCNQAYVGMKPDHQDYKKVHLSKIFDTRGKKTLSCLNT